MTGKEERVLELTKIWEELVQMIRKDQLNEKLTCDAIYNSLGFPKWVTPCMVYVLQGRHWLDWLKVTCNFASIMSRVLIESSGMAVNSVDDLSDSIRLRRKTFHKKSLCHSLYKIQLLVLLFTVSYLQVFSFFFFAG